RATGFRMLHLAAVEDLNEPAIAADAGEAGGETVIVLLRPAVVRMGMAPRAGDLRAEEHAANVLGEIAWIAAEGEKISRTIAGGGEQRADNGVQRGPLLNLTTYPVVVLAGRLFVRALAAGQQQ